MNVDSILKYEKNPKEDFYQILGCDRSSNTEQILTEFRLRAKDCHPDKSAGREQSDPETFQKLLKAKNTLIDSTERGYYDRWLDAGIAISFEQWRGLKDTVKTSMHWAVPKTERMLESDPTKTSDEVSPEKVITRLMKGSSGDMKQPEISGSVEDDEECDDGVTYQPTPYDSLGFSVPSPMEEWKKFPMEEEAGKLDKSDKTSKPDVSMEKEVDSRTAMRRKQFATRRESSIGAMVMTNKLDDDDIRRKFRTYEI